MGGQSHQLVDSRCGEVCVGAQVRRDCALPDSVRSRFRPLIFTVSRYLHIIHNIAVFADRLKRRKRAVLCIYVRAHTHTHTRTRRWWPTRSEHLFRRIRAAGFYLLSVFVYRLPAVNRRVKNDAKTSHEESSSRRWIPRRENGRRLLFVQEAEISEIRSLFTFESEEPRGFGNRYGLRGKMYRWNIFRGEIRNCSWNRIGIFHRTVYGSLLRGALSVHALIVLEGLREARNLINFFRIGGF